MRVFLISISMLALVASGAAAQSDPLSDLRRDADRAQASAASPANPEDETLTCEQIQAELNQSMESEDVEESMSELEEVEASQEEANRRASQGVGGGLGAIFGSMLPGARLSNDRQNTLPGDI